MGSPSFLAHQRALSEEQGRSNCQTLFGMSAIPSDNYIRLMLDIGVSPAAFQRSVHAGPRGGWPADLPVPVPGWTDAGRARQQQRISARARSNARSARRGVVPTAVWNASMPLLGASVVAPGHKQVLPLPPEFIAPQDGAEKQDCERNAASWLAGPARSRDCPSPTRLSRGRSGSVADRSPLAIQDTGGNFILTCKPSSHQTTTGDRIAPAALEEHQQTICKRGKRTILSTAGHLPACRCAPPPMQSRPTGSPSRSATLRGQTNLTITGFVTDLTVTADTVAERWPPAAWRGGRSRNVPNVLKPPAITLRQLLATAGRPWPDLLTPNLFAFAFHTAAHLAMHSALARGGRYRWRSAT